jgi:dihydrofolate synthase/folylpolyglutamate synthase
MDQEFAKKWAKRHPKGAANSMRHTPLGLSNRRPGRIRPELGPIRDALARLGDPQLAQPSILIVGTNGKGSTAAMLDAVLEAHGVSTGLTTSPHLIFVEERIRIGGETIDRAGLESYLARLAGFQDLTFFETVTCAAFLAFREAGVEVAVLEAGMGGSWDATRVAESSIAGITNVGSDHAAWLGDDALDRARDKGTPLRSAHQAVIGPGLAPELIEALGSPHAIPASQLIEVTPQDIGRLLLAWDDSTLEVPSPLVGDHQVANVHLALALARCAEAAGLLARLEPEAIARGLARVHWPGRLSEHVVGGRKVLVDVAHNCEGAEALAAHLARQPQRRNLLFSCLDDKDVEAMARVLAPVVDDVAVCQLEDDRAMPVERVAAAFPGAAQAGDPMAALGCLSDPVVAAGSLRLVGALLEVAEEGVGS